MAVARSCATTAARYPCARVMAASARPAMARPRGFSAKDQAATRRLVQAAQRGDRRAEDELVSRYEPLVQHTVWSLKLPSWCEREDLAQEARLGLVGHVPSVGVGAGRTESP